jgi:uncharacterized protein (DUF1501 family)
MLTRRQFLGRSATGLSFLSLGGLMPDLFAHAAESAAKSDRNDHVLVVVELAGGNDGLNTVIPFENDLYHKARPTLKIAKEQVVKLSDQIGLHPALEAAGELFKAGKLAVVQGVGYPEPDRSHFRSMEIWHTASTAKKVPATGWLGRILDHQFKPGDEEKLRGLGLAGALPQAFFSDKIAVPVVQQLETFAGGEEENAKQKLLRKLTTTPESKSGPVGFMRRQAQALYRTADQLKAAAEKYKSDVEYKGDLGNQFRRAAQIITADLGVRLFFLSQGGYDTHSQQLNQQQNLLTELSGALAAFQQDLEKQKLADKVLVLTFSEFGRRVDENASAGTDHGAASCLFVSGSKVKGGLAGTYPSLAKLGDGDLIHTVDFRSVYATVLEKWLGCPADKLLGEKFPQLGLLA